MNLGQFRTEVAARGFDYLSTTRLDTFINRAYEEIAEQEEWPWLYNIATGTAPLSVTDIRTIESVVDTTTQVKLVPLDRRHLTDIDIDLSTEGSPTYYYFSGQTELSVYPANATDTLSVRYWAVPTELVDTADTPALPSRFHYLIVTGALVYCYLDSDEAEQASGLSGEVAVGVARMRDSLLVQQHDRPDDFIVTTQAHLDAT